MIVPPVVRDSAARPAAEPDEDSEAAERRAEIADLTRRVVVGAALTTEAVAAALGEAGDYQLAGQPSPGRA